jgi:MFS family permease
LAISTHTWFVANATLSVVIAPFALLELDLSAFQFGAVTGLAGVGALAGAALTSVVGRRVGTGGAIMVARGVSAFGVVVMALSGIETSGWASAGILGAGVALHGFGMGLSNSHEMSYQQRLTPDGLQARVNTTMRSANRAVIVVVAPLAGLLADQFGMRPALLCAAVIFAFAVALLAMAPPLRVDEDASVGS